MKEKNINRKGFLFKKEKCYLLINESNLYNRPNIQQHIQSLKAYTTTDANLPSTALPQPKSMSFLCPPIRQLPSACQFKLLYFFI